MLPLFPLPSLLAPLQQQPKPTQELLRQVRKFVNKDLNLDTKGHVFVLGVSGGADSLALLCLWLWLRPVWQHTIHVLHLDHCLRPESAQEAATVQALCEAWHVPCRVVRLDVATEAQKHGQGLEEGARHLRYKILEEERKAVNAQWICTGHHAGDLEEDVVMRLVRGTGWPALGGMDAVDRQRCLLRPLLLQEPEALKGVLTHMGLGWAEDQSNSDTRYLRNRVRHTIMPLLRAENPALRHRLKDLWSMARLDKEHWDAELSHLLSSPGVDFNVHSATLPVTLLRNVDKATRMRLYLYAVRHCSKQYENKDNKDKGGQARANTLQLLDAAWEEGRGGTLFQFPGGITARLQRGSIIVTPRP